jgi:hypothetical protein
MYRPDLPLSQAAQHFLLNVRQWMAQVQGHWIEHYLPLSHVDREARTYTQRYLTESLRLVMGLPGQPARVFMVEYVGTHMVDREQILRTHQLLRAVYCGDTVRQSANYAFSS